MTPVVAQDGTIQPVCQCCQQTDQVSRVPMVRLDSDVEFWQCDRCGYIWELRHDDGALDLSARVQCSRLNREH